MVNTGFIMSTSMPGTNDDDREFIERRQILTIEHVSLLFEKK